MSEWRDVVGWEGRYQVSNLGETRSLVRTVLSTSGKRRTFEAGPLRHMLNSAGYPMVRLSKPGKRVCARVHRLVAMAFIPNPLNLPEVNHLDGNRKNPVVTNLEWTDASGNRQHAWDTGARPRDVLGLRGEGNGRAKLTTEQVLDARLRRSRFGTSFVKLGAEYGVSASTIQAAVKGEHWNVVSPLPPPPAADK